LLMLLVLFVLALARGLDENEARAMTFTSLMLASLGMIIFNAARTRPLRESLATPNAARWWVLGGGLALTFGALAVPAVREVFRFAPLSMADLALCFAAVALTLVGQTAIVGQNSV